MQFFTITNRGLEDINAKEIESLGAKLIESFDRINVFESQELPRIAYLTQTSSRILLLKAYTKEFDENNIIEELKKLASRADFSDLSKLTFAVRAAKRDIEVDTMKVHYEIGDIIRRKSNAKVNLDNPDVIVRVYITKDALLIGYDLFGKDPLDKRFYRVYYHPSALRATLANQMVRFSEWDKSKVLLDPLCGSGTIPIEAVMYMRRIPPLYKMDYSRFALTKLFDLNESFYEELNSQIRWNERAKIMCFDKFVKHMRGAELNCIHARCKDTMRIAKINLEDVDFKLGEKSVDYIITNPPYGIKSADREESQKVHEYLFYQADYILRDKGKVVVLTPHKDWCLEYASKYNFELRKERKVWNGELEVYLLEFSR